MKDKGEKGNFRFRQIREGYNPNFIFVGGDQRQNNKLN
jgi:hypothetical protein